MPGSGQMLARSVALAGAVLALGVVLAGCVGGVPTPTPTAADPSSSSSAGATPPPATPVINLNGTAAQNQAFFDQLNKKLIAKGGDLGGRSFIDNLVKAGYTKAAMEVTPDRTVANNQADNIQFSILLNGTCLIGSYGVAGYGSSYGPILGTGHCLIGTTRPINW
jgi:hypothetical protein